MQMKAMKRARLQSLCDLKRLSLQNSPRALFTLLALYFFLRLDSCTLTVAWSSFQRCYVFNHNLKSLRPFYESTSSLNCLLSSTQNAASKLVHYQVFARLSPLIAGPRLLPIHAEVILFHQANQSSIDIPTHIHRIDLLPTSPTDPKTLLKLISLQPVPSQIRHRLYVVQENSQDIITSNNLGSEYNIYRKNVSWDTVHQLLQYSESCVLDNWLSFPSFSWKHSEQGVCILVRLESTQLSTDTPSLIPIDLASFVESLKREKYSHLHLIHNNCYTFALDLLHSSLS